jgi:DNA-binding LacI/PurR family transcriptional regulator
MLILSREFERKSVAVFPAPTLHDVAKAVGTSTASVSRVIDIGPEASHQMRTNVELADRLRHYKPNLSASKNGQVSGKTEGKGN